MIMCIVHVHYMQEKERRRKVKVDRRKSTNHNHINTYKIHDSLDGLDDIYSSLINSLEKQIILPHKLRKMSLICLKK